MTRNRDLDALQVAALLERGEAILVDVREPAEFAAGHIPGAVNLPLSRFSPEALPARDGRVLILSCAAGGRSARAMAACDSAHAAVEGHLAGGFGAWKTAGLPIATGA